MRQHDDAGKQGYGQENMEKPPFLLYLFTTPLLDLFCLFFSPSSSLLLLHSP